MKLHVVSQSLLALCLTLAAIPAMAANTLYDNGLTNSTVGTWANNINGHHGA